MGFARVSVLEQEAAGVSDDAFAPLLQEEAAHVRRPVRSGILREISFRRDRPMAVLILECPGGAEAGEVLVSFPLFRRGLIRFDLIPPAPYPGFARLPTEERPPFT